MISQDILDSLSWLVSTLVIVGVAMLEEIEMTRRAETEYTPYRSRTPLLIPLPRVIISVFSLPMRLLTGRDFPVSDRDIAVTLALYLVILILLSLLFIALGLPTHGRMDIFPYMVFPFV